MEHVVASVSGYHGFEKFKLIKLINQTGASYVGTMSKSTTHLVCWKFEGRKYMMAKEFGTNVVNHCWFEDCLKHGKRLPEGPYLKNSGEQVGPLSFEVPVVVDYCAKEEERLLTRKDKKVLVDISNTIVDYNASKLDTRCLDIGCSTWSESCFPGEHEECSSHSYMLRPRRKKKRLIADENHDVDNYCKGRQLLKNYAPKAKMNFAVQEDSPDEFSPFDLVNELDNLLCTSRDSHISRMTSYNGILSSAEENLGQEDEIRESHHNLVSNDSDTPVISRSPSTENTTSQYVCPGSSNCHSGELKKADGINAITSLENITSQYEFHDTMGRHNGELDEVNGIEHIALPSTELSCVICWTDFSSTRGVLPCGHRFCFSCIQGWADHMTSRGKVSACPLCKASFDIITRVEGVKASDQKIYSQNLPCSSDEAIQVVLGGGAFYSATSELPERICYACHSHEPEDLLLSCHICRNLWVHSFCLDPPLVPWTCIHCKNSRSLYQRFR